MKQLVWILACVAWSVFNYLGFGFLVWQGVNYKHAVGLLFMVCLGILFGRFGYYFTKEET
jgi:hypothetical protein